MNHRRSRPLSSGRPEGQGPVLYWMHRDHRAQDNWALLRADQLAQQRGTHLVAAHCLDPAYPGASAPHFRFLLEGLAHAGHDMDALGIPLMRLLGDPPTEIVRLAHALNARMVVADFDSLRHKRAWMSQAAQALPCPLEEVDARNVVPCFAASDKAEYMARTIRPKIHRLLPEFLEDYPDLPRRERPSTPDGHGRSAHELDQAFADARKASIPGGFVPGEAGALQALERFVSRGLHGYAERRNDPALDGQSGLSPWLHFGMLSAQRAALAAAESSAPAADKEAFLEELIVRRELADNFCLHTPGYDTTACYPRWAAKTLAEHEADPRPALYHKDVLEAGRTADAAWNAAQQEMIRTGKMHGYMRMYWAKKLLEWSPDAASAQTLAVEFNDRYSLDGRDPNGYAGIAWAIGGVHDRPWVARPVFGQVRCMTASGLARKFDVQAYVERILGSRKRLGG